MLVVSGPSGVGKATVLAEITKSIVSAGSRRPFVGGPYWNGSYTTDIITEHPERAIDDVMGESRVALLELERRW